MARLFNSVEAKLFLTMKHASYTGENATSYEFDAFQGANISPNFVELLFKNFFNGECGGKTLTNETGKFKLILNGYDNNNTPVTKQISQENIYITKYEDNNNYIFKINDDDLVTLTYNDTFYLTDIEFKYIAPNPETGGFSNEISLITSNYPERSTFAIDIPNSDPAKKGVYLDPSIDNIVVYFDYQIIISK